MYASGKPELFRAACAAEARVRSDHILVGVQANFWCESNISDLRSEIVFLQQLLLS